MKNVAEAQPIGARRLCVPPRARRVQQQPTKTSGRECVCPKGAGAQAHLFPAALPSITRARIAIKGTLCSRVGSPRGAADTHSPRPPLFPSSETRAAFFRGGCRRRGPKKEPVAASSAMRAQRRADLGVRGGAQQLAAAAGLGLALDNALRKIPPSR